MTQTQIDTMPAQPCVAASTRACAMDWPVGGTTGLSLIVSLDARKRMQSPISSALAVSAAQRISPACRLRSMAEPTALIKKAGPELTQKNSMRCACFCVIRAASSNCTVMRAPTG